MMQVTFNESDVDSAVFPQFKNKFSVFFLLCRSHLDGQQRFKGLNKQLVSRRKVNFHRRFKGQRSAQEFQRLKLEFCISVIECFSCELNHIWTNFLEDTNILLNQTLRSSKNSRAET